MPKPGAIWSRVVIEEIEIRCEECYVLRSVHLSQDTIIMAKMEVRMVRCLVFGEDSEEAGAAAGERGVEGAVGVEGGFYGCEFGMQLKDGLLEIIDELFAPLGDR